MPSQEMLPLIFMGTLSPIHLCESAIHLNSFSNIYFFTIIRLQFIYILYRNNWFSSSYCLKVIVILVTSLLIGVNKNQWRWSVRMCVLLTNQVERENNCRQEDDIKKNHRTRFTVNKKRHKIFTSSKFSDN
jgi:hypothetical protein